MSTYDKKLYTDKEYIKSTLDVIDDNIDDLSKISVYNEDMINQPLDAIIHELKHIREILKV